MFAAVRERVVHTDESGESNLVEAAMVVVGDLACCLLSFGRGYFLQAFAVNV
jgi:hypothetical protein